MSKKKPVNFKVGDSVCITAGQRDEDTGIDISGWQGRIVEFYPEDKTCLLALDSITLKNMPRAYLENAEEEGLGWSEYVIELEYVQAAEPRDTPKEVEEIIDELEYFLGMAWLGEEGRAMNAIMAGADSELERIEAWINHLEQNLTFPFDARISEWQSPQSVLQTGEQVKVTALNDFYDDHYGVFVKVKKGRRSYDCPLCELKAIPPSSPNHDLVQLYSVWFANR